MIAVYKLIQTIYENSFLSTVDKTIVEFLFGVFTRELGCNEYIAVGWRVVLHSYIDFFLLRDDRIWPGRVS